MDAQPAALPPDHRTVCIRLREMCIQQIRLVRDLMHRATPERGQFYRELIGSMTQTVRLIEKDAGLRAWEGA